MGMLQQGVGFIRVEPDAVAVGALVDLDAIPIVGDQVVAAFGALHVMRLALGFAGGPLGAAALLAPQLGIASREVLVLVLAPLVRHRAQRFESCLTFSVSPPWCGRPPGGIAAGELDCPLS